LQGPTAMHGRLIPYFRPRIRLADGAVTGFEALARRITDHGQVLPPSRFLSHYATPTARTGLMLSMLEAVLRLAGQRRGVDLPVSLNIDAMQLSEATFIEAIFSVAAAEGVETAEILQMLKPLGCDEAQGYAIARPMPGDEVLGWIRRSGRALCIDERSLAA
jgi:EAL domain-containing protein (putative c-di-GMP-specific phosphodiesterase class I)